MNFTLAEKIKFKRFCQEIIDKPRELEVQAHIKEGAFLWCEDWEMIEIMKFLFLEEFPYMNDPSPRRLKGNPLWSKAEIKTKTEELVKNHGTADKIIETLREKRSEAASRIA